MMKIGSFILSVLLAFNFSACTGNPQVVAPSEVHTSIAQNASEVFSLSEVPEYSGAPFIAVHDNTPYFTKDEISTKSFEDYSPLDSLGRCGVCISSIGPDIMPTEEREPIGSVKPTGWHSVKYDNVDGKFLYNRCHLIGFQLTGENANEENLITGTRYLNTEGMLPFENMIADYVKEAGNHVMYRVTPVFEGNNLVAHGVLLEGYSVEDSGAGILFCVYCYNVQPGITIDYKDGSSQKNIVETAPENQTTDASEKESSYVLNTNSKKFHKPTCGSVSTIKPKNRKDVSSSRDKLLSEGYSPCGSCRP